MSQTNASEPTLFRLRVSYVKLGRCKYLSHLEVIHTVERIIRRAKLPYAVTQGFSPHMRIAYSSALPVGTSSRREFFDVYLTEHLAAKSALERLRAAAPQDLMPLSAGYIDLRSPSLTAAIDEVTYHIAAMPRDSRAFAERVERLAEAYRRPRYSLPHGSTLDDALTCVLDVADYTVVRGKKRKSVRFSKQLDGWEGLIWPDGSMVFDCRAFAGSEGRDGGGYFRPDLFMMAFDRLLSGIDPQDVELVVDGTPTYDHFSSVRIQRASQYVSRELFDDSGEGARSAYTPMDVASVCCGFDFPYEKAYDDLHPDPSLPELPEELAELAKAPEQPRFEPPRPDFLSNL